MLSTIASLITLAAFVLPAAYLIYMLPVKRIPDMVLQALHGILMGLGGLLFAGLMMKLLALTNAPILSSALVLVGSIACLVVYRMFIKPAKAAH